MRLQQRPHEGVSHEMPRHQEQGDREAEAHRRIGQLRSQLARGQAARRRQRRQGQGDQQQHGRAPCRHRAERGTPTRQVANECA
ncbi:hypothetical protein G6F55_014151 [Rhizopus delemar]|nr:hypothetical protein G6F55_014151 [Rhizopus delemar]